MCGIIFTYNTSELPDKVIHRTRKALTALKHRGPDDEGIWQEGPVVIGHRRLSIIDISKSRQPMISPDQNFVLSYNGEIYNFRQLREELSDKWSFVTNGDTEVLLAGLTIHGLDFCKKMEGMWAFTLWDKRSKTLWLSRDRIGKKPLYYQSTNNGISCASELPALDLITPQWQEDFNSTADYFRYGFNLPGTTAYTGVKEILAGHIAIWQPDTPLKQIPYWQLPLKKYTGSREAAKEKLKQLFIEAVKKRMIADVEVGAFLSGGIDSSLIVSTMCKDLGILPKTFTIGFQNNGYDERKFARLVANSVHSDHHEEILSNLQYDDIDKLISAHLGQPFADSSILPTTLVSKLAAKHVKVVLSGDGADELFSGYQRYQAQIMLNWYLRLPKALRKNIHGLLRAIPEPMTHHSNSILKKAQLFSDIAKTQTNNQYIAPQLFSESELFKMAPNLKNLGHSPANIAEETNLEDLKKMMARDTLIYLPQDILTKVDRASMSVGLESRAPFLDTAIIEFAFSLPSNWHRHGFCGKCMLKKTFADKLPASIWRRRKQGFSVPVNRWLQGDLGDVLLHWLDGDCTPLDSKTIKEQLHQHKKGTSDHGHKLWAIYLYARWRNRWLPAL